MHAHVHVILVVFEACCINDYLFLLYFITLCAKLSGAVYCYRSCLVCLQRAGRRCLLPW